MTVRIAANDKHMFSAVSSHVGQRHGLVVEHKVRDCPWHARIEARPRRKNNPVMLRSDSIEPWHGLCRQNDAGGFEGSAPNPTPSSDYIPLGRRCAFDRYDERWRLLRLLLLSLRPDRVPLREREPNAKDQYGDTGSDCHPRYH